FGDQRSKHILAGFLKAVLPGLAAEELVELTIVDPQLKREFGGDKLEILDVKVRTAKGKSIDIEIQISAVPEMRSRISYYLSNMITEQIGMGGYYTDLKQAISIIITDYDFIPETGRCHTVYRMLETEEHFPFNELMEIHVLNLAKLAGEGEGELLDWLRFLRAEGEEEIKMVAEKNAMINEAYCKLQVMSEDEANRMIYEARLKAQRDEHSRIQGAWKEGREEGREEGRQEGRENGRQEGRREIIFQMAEHGMDIKAIAAITRLSEGEVGSIVKVKRS
ncbi:MAG: Rpn family recombination-promoting nuclease/putative transposase, partial [Treponema sp.]|nr:Rpn family recombination-promoting nuclease/putative transposase [Treponema sp.]